MLSKPLSYGRSATDKPGELFPGRNSNRGTGFSYTPTFNHPMRHLVALALADAGLR
ncbi:hypothetical protein HRbin36_02586 [bacterium HR36]|nr:hypothetical protein HRbin36_02586 [bacterium HR36]